MTIRNATVDDASALVAIYNYYITDTVVTFEEETISADEMRLRIVDVQNRHLPWMVWESDGLITGFAYANRFRDRVAYRYSVESTVYLDPAHVGQGIGIALYSKLIDELRASPLQLRCVIGGVALPNEASVKLHERLGFDRVGVFSAVGFKFNRWIDVGFWQLNL